MNTCDVLILGGGAAGLFCALTAGQRNRRVQVLEGSNRIGKKILMSGGGRCNFTHLHSTPAHFLSHNPNYCKSALARYTPYDFLELVERHDIDYVEKSPGQLFCRDSSKAIVRMLATECERASVTIHTDAAIEHVCMSGDRFVVQASDQVWESGSLVIATGGLSIPKMGASDFGYRIARQFDLPIVDTRAGLVPFTFSGALLDMMKRLRGVSVVGRVGVDEQGFVDGLVFTHRGLSGPAALQASSYWREGQFIEVDLLSGRDAVSGLLAAKRATPKRSLLGEVAQWLPRSLSEAWLDVESSSAARNRLADCPDGLLRDIGTRLNRWSVKPAGTEGYRTAEVTLGGVDTHGLDSRTMMARDWPGLFFIGEVVDVTGHLGGHNFQWAWASAHAAGQVA